MNTLVVYFSRSGRTRKLAKEVAEKLSADLDEIREARGRSGPIGWIKSGMESTRKALPKLLPPVKDPAKYDLVVLGTPIWASNMSSPMRAYITEHRDAIKEAAFILTGDGNDPQSVFEPMEELLERAPVATLSLIGKEREGDARIEKIEGFVNTLATLGAP
ncbi:MAG TPA: hypothetical protein VM050_05170 [Patescibacteria group bacterium]|nr:hypothetical protein [Patescibacteria group bacterium]